MATANKTPPAQNAKPAQVPATGANNPERVALEEAAALAEAQARADALANQQQGESGNGAPVPSGLTGATGLKFKVKRAIARSVVQFAWGVPVFLKIESAIYKGKEVKTTPPMPAPDMADVVDLETGEEKVCIFSTVLLKNLLEAYPPVEGETVPAYVGKSFRIKNVKKADKRYNNFDIAEVEIED